MVANLRHPTFFFISRCYLTIVNEIFFSTSGDRRSKSRDRYKMRFRILIGSSDPISSLHLEIIKFSS